MNVFSRVKDAFSRAKTMLFSRKQRDKAEEKAHNSQQPESKPKRRKWLHVVRMINPKRPIRGPVFLPSAEYHHVSRQTCRARLRGIFFAQYSVQYPLASRRQRRRIARLAAQLEYRRMMNDTANRISDDDVALAQGATD